LTDAAADEDETGNIDIPGEDAEAEAT